MRFTLLLLALWFACVLFSIAQAAGLTPEQARGVLFVAYGQYHGPRTLLDDPPEINSVSQEDLQERYGCTSHCYPVHGLYDEDTRKVYVWDQLDFSTVYATTVLLHEFIHHFQVKTKGKVMDRPTNYDRCMEAMSREREAYLIQAHVLLQSGEHTHSRNVRLTIAHFSPYACKRYETQ